MKTAPKRHSAREKLANLKISPCCADKRSRKWIFATIYFLSSFFMFYVENLCAIFPSNFLYGCDPLLNQGGAIEPINTKENNLQQHNALQIQWKQSPADVGRAKFCEFFQNA